MRAAVVIAPRVVVYHAGGAPPEVGEGWLALAVMPGWAPPGGVRSAAAAGAVRRVGVVPAAANTGGAGFARGPVFGDGSHPTTRLCAAAVDMLCRQQPGLSVLDVGTGTGILARIAFARGAGFVVGTDIDPVAVECARAHAELDSVGTHGRRIHFASDPPDHWGARFNLVVANILEAPLHCLSPALCRALLPGGVLLISGFTRPQAPALRLAYETAGLQSIGEFCLDEWALLKFSAPAARPSRHSFSK
ncbi:MAG: 50S ribosomal protein L11 methyltransferase [Proteobacteria bacterium]|nr:50S ribosomal protein L11 methyltransferase [Pseudomonadota bacterium]